VGKVSGRQWAGELIDEFFANFAKALGWG